MTRSQRPGGGNEAVVLIFLTLLVAGTAFLIYLFVKAGGLE